MEMINRAIEDASDGRAFVRALQASEASAFIGRRTGKATLLREAKAAAEDLERRLAEVEQQQAGKPAKRPGENRAQYRARVYG